MDTNQQSVALHKEHRGKIGTEIKVPLETRQDISLAYTPGVAAVCMAIAQDSAKAREYTNIGNTVAIVTDGTAVLGLGNIGPLGAMPVMEGKAVLFKRFAGLDAVPLVLGTQNVDEIIATVKAIAPSFAGINLEDIAAPNCFVIEAALKKALNIPVFHDDQHGTAIVVLAGLISAIALRGISHEDARVVINGAGAAGLAIFDVLWAYGYRHISVVDSVGVLRPDRADLTEYKREIAEKIAAFASHSSGATTLAETLADAHVFIGVSKGNVLTADHVRSMAEKPIIFAMANPTPEIMPDIAREAGAYIIATGRSDFANQINNALVFPGLFRGAIDNGVVQITTDHMVAVARAIAALVTEPAPDVIIPDIFDPRIVPAIAAVFAR